MHYEMPPKYLPSEEEIKEQCRLIRETWSERERLTHIVAGVSPRVEIIEYAVRHPPSNGRRMPLPNDNHQG